jgi:hypothetical protein
MKKIKSGLCSCSNRINEPSIIDDFIKENPISLETRIKVSTQIAFINLIHELGYRKEGYWKPEEDELLNNLINLADKHTENILEEIKKENEST